MIQALQFRVSGLTGLANALAATAATKNVSRAASLLAAQMQRPLASDVVWDDSFQAPSQAELKLQGITGTNDQGGPLVPDSNFLAEPGARDDERDDARPRAAPRRGHDGTTGGLRGTCSSRRRCCRRARS